MSVYSDTVRDRFGGLLRPGSHEPDGVACALEAAAVARGRKWSDNPEVAGLPDLRPLNDAGWSSDQARTVAMVQLVDALWDWPEWTDERRTDWSRSVALRTVREVLPIALDTANLHSYATACREAHDLVAAKAAASAASKAASKAADAAKAASWAADAADAASWAAAEAATWDAVWAASAAAKAAAKTASRDGSRRLLHYARADAVWAAAMAARAAVCAADAARAADRVLVLSCEIMREEALKT